MAGKFCTGLELAEIQDKNSRTGLAKYTVDTV